MTAMELPIHRHLRALAQRDPLLRRQAVEDTLAQEGVACEIQQEEPSFENPNGIRNYLFRTGDRPGLLYCAHYDSLPGSPGANDNAASLCILIDLARTFREEGISASFAFFDGEENKQAGSRFYVSSLDREQVTGAVNLDLCGYGDTLAVCGRGHERKPALRPLCARERLKRYHGQLLSWLPPSDDRSFSGLRLPTLSIAMVPYWDIQYLKALSRLGSGLLGRPPEYDLVFGQMEIASTMHGGFRDSVEWVAPEAMERVYAYLLESAKER